MIEFNAEGGTDQDKYEVIRRIGSDKFRANDPIQMKRVTMKFGDLKAVDRMTLSI